MNSRLSVSRLGVSIALVCALLFSACANSSPFETSVGSDDNSTLSPTNDAATVETSESEPIAVASDDSNAAKRGPLPAVVASEDEDNATTQERYFAEFGPIMISGFGQGLESCAGVDPAPYTELLGIDLVVKATEQLADVEPSAPDRTCVLYAAENPDIDLIRINAVDDADNWVRWNLHTPQLETVDVGLFKASDDNGSYRLGTTGDFGYATLEVVAQGVDTGAQQNSKMLIEARLWDSGIEYTPVEIDTIAAMASIAANQLTSSAPGPATSVLGSCGELENESWAELIGGEIDGFVASSFNGSLTCTAQSSTGNRVQILVAETSLDEEALARTGLLRSAYEATLREPDQLSLDGIESAWEIDRIYDDNLSQTEQSVLQEAFGNQAGVFARVSIRQDTRGQRASINMVGRALAAVLTGENFRPEDPEPEPKFRFPTTDAVKQFVDSGATIEVAPLTRGIGACSTLDLTPFEAIVGKELVAVAGIVEATLNPNIDLPNAETEPTGDEIKSNPGTAADQRIVECSLARKDRPSVIEMRVSASSSPAGAEAWTNADLITGLLAIDGIDDVAFWNEGKGNSGDNEAAEGAGLVLYIEEGEARLLVELVKYTTTPNIDLFWVSQAFARELFAPAS